MESGKCTKEFTKIKVSISKVVGTFLSDHVNDLIEEGRLVRCTMINQPVDAGLLREAIMHGWPADELIRAFNNDLQNVVRQVAMQEGISKRRLEKETG